ncbi:hypothetical protein FHQ08_07140 [Lactobacillus sp. CC-MHH1034]|uniref:hypothetical protein n=1 Tax=Agrilactobacillus fermenti TaxID=2586909 RepID=UPI001E41C3DF|nr:hypothetical protein [Agrilactobacillus fermenti]MCD2256493.1 hypothetical protein [Agrilactobacillus fermenti]
MTYRILIYDFIFLVFLSLVPLTTNMMASNTTRITVIIYGVLQIILSLSFRVLSKAIIHFKYTDKQDMQQVYMKIYGGRSRAIAVGSVVFVVLAYFVPRVVVVFYLVDPIASFIVNSQKRQEMYDLEQLTPDQRQDLLKLDGNDGLKKFRDFLNRQRPDSEVDSTEQVAAEPVKTEPASVQTETPKETQQATTETDPVEGFQTWLDNVRTAIDDRGSWLDNNVNPRDRDKQKGLSKDEFRKLRRQQFEAWMQQRPDHGQGRPSQAKLTPEQTQAFAKRQAQFKKLRTQDKHERAESIGKIIQEIQDEQDKKK